MSHHALHSFCVLNLLYRYVANDSNTIARVKFLGRFNVFFLVDFEPSSALFCMESSNILVRPLYQSDIFDGEKAHAVSLHLNLSPRKCVTGDW